MDAQHAFRPNNLLALGGRDMHEDALMRYSEAVGNATNMAAQDELPPTLMVACLTRFIDVVVRCADDDGFSPSWGSSQAKYASGSSEEIERTERRASA